MVVFVSAFQRSTILSLLDFGKVGFGVETAAPHNLDPSERRPSGRSVSYGSRFTAVVYLFSMYEGSECLCVSEGLLMVEEKNRCLLLREITVKN